MNIERLREERGKLIDLKRQLDLAVYNLERQISDMSTEISREHHAKLNEYIKAKGLVFKKKTLDE